MMIRRFVIQGMLLSVFACFLTWNTRAGVPSLGGSSVATNTPVMIPGGIPGGIGTIPPVPPGGNMMGAGGAIPGSPAIDPTTGLPPLGQGGAGGGSPGSTNNIPQPQIQTIITEEMYEEAMRIFIKDSKSIRREAEAGNTRQQHNLGVLYTLGLGVPLDHQKAFGWFTKAANEGLMESQFNVAIALQEGLGARKDMVVSYKFYVLAAANGMQNSAIARDHLATFLSREQIETGQRMARGFIMKLERRERLAKREETEKRRMEAILKGLDPNVTPSPTTGGENNN